MEHGKKILVEVAYALPEKQHIVSLEIEESATIEEIIKQSGILTLFPDINLEKQQVGVFSQQKKLSDHVRYGDRIEIYRPLLIDPKEARRKRGGLY